MTGWIKLHRKVLDDGWLSEHKLWAVWCYCLLKASYQDTEVFFNGIQVTLLKGQLIFGRKKAARELKLGEQEIRTCINKLKKFKNITTKSTNHYTVITIVNWDTYQSEEDGTNQRNNQDLTNGQPAPNHIQEVKKEKKERIYFSIPPSLQEVTQYCKERNNSIEPQAFIDYYEARGWLIGKVKMKNWQAAIRTWEKNQIQKPKEVSEFI